MTETAPQTPQNKVMLFSITAKNETAFKIKQLATLIHFISLVALGFLYFVEHERTFHCFIIASTSFALAMFIPPTGLISTDDAPNYAKNSMSYMPPKAGAEEEKAAIPEKADAKAAKAGSAKSKKKSKKKN